MESQTHMLTDTEASVSLPVSSGCELALNPLILPTNEAELFGED